MAQPQTEVCTPWTTEGELGSPCDDYVTDASLLADMIDAASWVLFELSGRQFPGICSDFVRPCRQPWGCWCESRPRRCGCSVSEITLGGSPIVNVTEVKIDGAVLDASRYRVDDYRYLVRLPDADGTNPGWPSTQRMDLEATEADTFQVTFEYGRMPPQMGRTAAAALACELYKSTQPELLGQCRLPKRVTSITRQGVNIALLDPFAFLDEGKTGLYDVDLFLKTANPHGLRRRASVVAPHTGRRRAVRRADT